MSNVIKEEVDDYYQDNTKSYNYNIKQKLKKLQKEGWISSLKCTSYYLEIYKKQITQADDFDKYYSREKHVDIIYPFPMFEYRADINELGIITSNQRMLIKKGMPANFHVLYAEAELLKMLIES
jgi:hypothetical protein